MLKMMGKKIITILCSKGFLIWTHVSIMVIINVMQYGLFIENSIASSWHSKLRAYPGSESVVANTLAKWKKLGPKPGSSIKNLFCL